MQTRITNTNRSPTIWIGLFLIVEAFLIFVPMSILGAAIGWPESLGAPPAEAFILISENTGAVRLGYGVYLLFSILFLFVGAAVVALTTKSSQPIGVLGMLVIVTAGLSALARTIGIIRWLTASLALADSHAAGSGQDAAIATQLAVNAWGGAIGEFLGVSLFAALFTILASVLIIQSQRLPAILGWIGIVVAVISASPGLELFGIEWVGVAAGTSVLHLWITAIGIFAIVSAVRHGSAKPEP